LLKVRKGGKMKRVLSLICLVALVFSLGLPAFAAKKVVKKVKPKAAVKKVVKKPVVTPASSVAPLRAAPQSAVAPSPAPAAVASRALVLKGGLAGGAGLIAAEYLMPMGPVMLGGEAGYAIGNSFGIIDAGVKVVYSMGSPFVGLEVAYAGYSKNVKEVPGLSGTVKSGAGVGLVAGLVMNPMQIQVGYNTALGLRADAGYRIYL
jgi:hypothetical protein